MKLRRVRRGAGLLAAAIAVTLAGCSVESKDGPETTAPTSNAYPAPPAPAISPGVTDNTIKIGFVYPDLAGVKQYIHVDHGDYAATFTALADKINAAGGINGRKIIPVFGGVNVLSAAGATETCVRLTQDEKVFAVLGTLNADDSLCYVQTHKTALVGGDLTTARYAKAQAPWFSTLRGGDEVADGIAAFGAGGALDGKKVAVVSNQLEQQTARDIVLPALDRLGVTPVENATVEIDAADQAASNQRINVVIQKFQAVGADTVIVVGGLAGNFPGLLADTTYRPKLLFTSNNSATAFVRSDDNAGKLGALPGSTGIGLVTDYNEKSFLDCTRTVAAAIPETAGKFQAPADVQSGQPTYAVSASVACSTLSLFQAIAEKAGRDLTYATFQKAGFSLGSFRVPASLDPATFGPQTPHGAIKPHLYTYDTSSKNFVVKD
ncbi:hypothetical protein Franean1_3247 [Parafrankia sp. EAN1pec]|uniref:ABC transporter substrate-binding protein n=1 Tax=Parafrankia sp. (strain EAN1pec) TaxID=298653 RepID=UPI0000542E01|nr:hypothetical protein Franean1_3247 [Frankia sp. EAN1pec]